MTHADVAAIVDPAAEPMIDGRFICRDLQITDRTRRNYREQGILQPPDANLNGRDLWKLSTYRKFKEDLLAGKFAKPGKRPPHLRPDER